MSRSRGPPSSPSAPSTPRTCSSLGRRRRGPPSRHPSSTRCSPKSSSPRGRSRRRRPTPWPSQSPWVPTRPCPRRRPSPSTRGCATWWPRSTAAPPLCSSASPRPSPSRLRPRSTPRWPRPRRTRASRTAGAASFLTAFRTRPVARPPTERRLSLPRRWTFLSLPTRLPRPTSHTVSPCLSARGRAPRPRSRCPSRCATSSSPRCPSASRRSSAPGCCQTVPSTPMPTARSRCRGPQTARTPHWCGRAMEAST
mmetsp:Transcript_32423/g.82738  ORF Transcript_32423/g.82738 Transcript_32423/m.82738 type:complete len:253 (-) Transcript_32423:1419-2177(-)